MRSYAKDSVLYLAPEIQLLYKSSTGRAKDAADLRRVLPHLPPERAQWLLDGLRQQDPQGHEWVQRVSPGPPAGSVEPVWVSGISSANVTFLGRVDDGTVRDVLSGARVTLVPSTEGFGLVTLEPLACGTPVVARGLGGPREGITHASTGFLVKDATPERFAEATGAALRLETPPQTLRASVQSFSLPAFLSRIAAVLAGMGVRTHAPAGGDVPPPGDCCGRGQADGTGGRYDVAAERPGGA